MEVNPKVTQLDTWMDRAACKGMDDVFFFAGPGGNERDLLGLEVCKTCPVRRECLDYAIDNRFEFGVFGGVTSDERKSIKRLRPLRPTLVG